MRAIVCRFVTAPEKGVTAYNFKTGAMLSMPEIFHIHKVGKAIRKVSCIPRLQITKEMKWCPPLCHMVDTLE